MSDNGLEIKISVDDYSKKSVDEKLDILYQVNLAQQQFCGVKVGEFDGRIRGIETSRKLEKAKIVGIGIGSGGGAAAFVSWIKNMFSGG